MASHGLLEMETYPMSTRHGEAGQLWLLASGFGIWSSALAFVYVIHSVGCIFDWPANTVRLGLGLAILAHLAGIGWLWRVRFGSYQDGPGLGRTEAFLNWVIFWTLIAAFVTIIFTLGPTLLLTTCT